MLVNIDFKSLEVVVAAFLSQDPVLMRELREGQDIHQNNMDAFGLPDRITAKRFVFRLLYGGSAFSYANDPDFMPVSRSEKYWQKVIDAFYEKYAGIKQWHERLLEEAQSTGRLTLPNGRFFPITPDYSKREPWPLTIIKNYPVQALGADLVMLARLEIRKQMTLLSLLSILVTTIHDSVVGDCPDDEYMIVAQLFYDAVQAVPRLCKQVFGFEFNLPTTGEVQVGKNAKDMEDITKLLTTA